MSLEEFTTELNRLMAETGHNQSTLARQSNDVGSAAMIGSWVRGQTTNPDPVKVFAVERALGARPGQLSRHLGYVPNEALEPTRLVGFGQWMDEHADRLTGRQRELLTGIYDEFVGSLPPMSADFRAEVTAEDRAAEERALRAGLSPRPPRRPDEGHQRPA